MTIQPSDISDAQRALRGDNDHHVASLIRQRPDIARVVALSNSADPGMRTLAAIVSGLTALLVPEEMDHPSVKRAIRDSIGSRQEDLVLRGITGLVPAGWGADIDVVQRRTCAPWIAAALGGPNDDIGRMLSSPEEISYVVRVWAKKEPTNPTWWMDYVSPDVYDHMMTRLRTDPTNHIIALPALPDDEVDAIRTYYVHHEFVYRELAGIAPLLRPCHDDVIDTLIQHETPGPPSVFDNLVLLAATTGLDSVWDKVRDLLAKDAFLAGRIVAIVPWRFLPETVANDILAYAGRNDVCDAIAAARGETSLAPEETYTAREFFAATSPDVWDELSEEERQRWRAALSPMDVHLAIRSLGLRPDLLAIHGGSGELALNDIVAAARHHGESLADIRSALLPVALSPAIPHALSIKDAYALTIALPDMPADPRTWFCLSSGHGDLDAIPPTRASALQTPADLAAAIVLQRIAAAGWIDADHRQLLHDALQNRSWDNVNRLLAYLSPKAAAASFPSPDELVPEYKHDAMRTAMAELATLPPATAIPVCIALTALRAEFIRSKSESPWNPRPVLDIRTTESVRGALRETIAQELRSHGSVFLSLFNALPWEDRGTLLPASDDRTLFQSVVALASADPLCALRMGTALKASAHRQVGDALRSAPPEAAAAALNALPPRLRALVVDELALFVAPLAAAGQTESLDRAWRTLCSDNPALAIAIAAQTLPEADDRRHGAALLSTHADALNGILPFVHHAAYQQLTSAGNRSRSGPTTGRMRR